MKSLLCFIGSLLIIQTIASCQTNKYPDEEGIASYYNDTFEGRITANGEKYKGNLFTAAHKTLPFGTMVKVTKIEDGKSVEVKINDRGPNREDRIIDLSRAAAEELDFIQEGITKVRIEVLSRPESQEIKLNKARKKERELNEIYTSEYYRLEVEKLKTTGSRYGIQIGTFVELVNMMRMVDDLKSKYQKQVVVKVDEEDEEKVYKIAVGNYPSRAKAEKLKNILADKFPDSFIVRY